MQCLYPVKARARKGGIDYDYVRPCTQCHACRYNKSQELMSRHEFEASTWRGVCAFVTLTYAPKYLPGPPGVYGMGSLRREDIVHFKKRLRENLERKYGIRVRIHAVGEYGTKNKRPHYHLIIYGLTPDQAEIECYRAWSEPGSMSPEENETIPREIFKRLPNRRFYGQVQSLPVKDGCTAYVTKYVLKGHTSKQNFNNSFPTDTREPEFSMMPNNPGLGYHGMVQMVSQLQRYKIYYLEYPETNHWGDKGLPMNEIKYRQRWYDGVKKGTYLMGKYARDKVRTMMGVKPDKAKTPDELFAEKRREAIVNEMKQNRQKNLTRKGLVTVEQLEEWLRLEKAKKAAIKTASRIEKADKKRRL